MNREIIRRRLFYKLALKCGAHVCINFNFILCRDLVITVNTPVQERTASYRMIAGAGVCYALLTPFAYQDGCVATVL